MKISVGDLIPPFRMERVTPERMKTVAAIFRDPFPVHWDRESTPRDGLRGQAPEPEPDQPGYVINMLIDWAGPTCLRRIRAQFPQPVFDSESVEAGGSVVSISQETGESVAECEVWLDRQDGTRSVVARAWVALPGGSV